MTAWEFWAEYTRDKDTEDDYGRLKSWAAPFAEAYAAREREECARIAEGYAQLHIESNPCHIQAKKKTAAKIRARGRIHEGEPT